MFQTRGLFDAIRGMFARKGGTSFAAFSPLSLFSSGEQGAWYDPSDISSMFQNAAGTTPAALEQPVGRILDKSGRGNHASQTTLAARPVLSARYNLLMYTEDFSNAYWSVKVGTTVGPPSVTAPNGTSTANVITATAETSVHVVQSGAVPGVTVAQKLSIYAKAGTHSFIQLSTANYTESGYVNFDLSNGSYSATTATGSISDVGNGWYLCTMNAPSGASNAGFQVALVSSISAARAQSWTTVGTETAFLWGADLRVANDGANLPAYQRVGAATAGSSTVGGTADYDTVGFPTYLRFDGVDDWMDMPAASMPVSGVTVVSGIMVVSNTNTKVVVARAYTWGSFQFIVRSNNASDARKLIFGVGQAGVDQAQANSSSIADNGTIIAVGTYNKTVVGSAINTDAQATTPYVKDITYNANDRATLGAFRDSVNSIASPMNGRLYGLVLRTQATDSVNLNKLITWMNGKTKALAG